MKRRCARSAFPASPPARACTRQSWGAGGGENPGKFFFIVDWESVDAHNAARDSEAFKAFAAVGAPFFGLGGGLDHFVTVV